jgi:hypothetical protein
MTTKAQHVQKIVLAYREDGQEWPATAKMIASWAVRKGLWSTPRRNAIQLAAKDIAYGMREEVFTDPQGRRVRKKHAFKESELLRDGSYEQQTLWIDIEDADPDQMEAAFKLRRLQILGDCKHLKTDVDSFNDNNRFDAEIQMEFDFTQDLVELGQPTEYVGPRA